MMAPEVVGLLVVVAVLVAVIAGYLIWVAYTLSRVSFTLGTVLIGVRAIVEQVEPVPKYVSIILNDALAIDQAANQLLGWGQGGQASDDPVLARAVRQ